MIEAACEDFSNLITIDLDAKLQPVNQSIDALLTRLEEFETMVLLIQQERCNAIGLTGSLTDCLDFQPQLQALSQRIDTLEKLIQILTNHINQIELRLCTLEEKYGLKDDGNGFTSFLKTNLLSKISPSPRLATVDLSEPLQELSIKEYFCNKSDESKHF